MKLEDELTRPADRASASAETSGPAASAAHAGRPRMHLIVQAILGAAFLAAVVFVSVKFGPAITKLMSRPEEFRALVASYGFVSVLIYIGIQAAHVVIVIIPGEIVQIAAGYAFGTLAGTLYSLIGILVGTVVVFFATRLFGYPLVKALVPPNKLERLTALVNGPKSEIAMFVLFLIPGIPKDTLVYLSGLTPVRPLRFLIICAVARFPGLWGSAYIGAHLQKQDYLTVGIMSGVALALFVTGVLLRDKIIAYLHSVKSRGGGGGTDGAGPGKENKSPESGGGEAKEIRPE